MYPKLPPKPLPLILTTPICSHVRTLKFICPRPTESPGIISPHLFGRNGVHGAAIIPSAGSLSLSHTYRYNHSVLLGIL